MTQSSAFPAILIKAVDCKRRTKGAVYVVLDYDNLRLKTPSNVIISSLIALASMIKLRLLYVLKYTQKIQRILYINVLESRGSSEEGVRTPCTLPLDPLIDAF